MHRQRRLWGQRVSLRALSSPPPRVPGTAGPGRLVRSQQETAPKDTASLAWGSGQRVGLRSLRQSPFWKPKGPHRGDAHPASLWKRHAATFSHPNRRMNTDCCPRACVWYRALGGSLALPGSFSEPRCVCCPGDAVRGPGVGGPGPPPGPRRATVT